MGAEIKGNPWGAAASWSGARRTEPKSRALYLGSGFSSLTAMGKGNSSYSSALFNPSPDAGYLLSGNIKTDQKGVPKGI